MFGVDIKPREEVFHILPINKECWEIANDLRGDFSPATVINYVSRIAAPDQFRAAYRDFMIFADAANAAIKERHKK